MAAMIAMPEIDLWLPLFQRLVWLVISISHFCDEQTQSHNGIHCGLRCHYCIFSALQWLRAKNWIAFDSNRLQWSRMQSNGSQGKPKRVGIKQNNTNIFHEILLKCFLSIGIQFWLSIAFNARSVCHITEERPKKFGNYYKCVRSEHKSI